MNVVLLGAPGSGKGTQAQTIKDAFGLRHVSTGDMLRAAVASGTELGLRAKAFMDRGELVPDDVVVGIVSERLRSEDGGPGWLLDGFPRTVAQAEALEKAFDGRAGRAVDRVLYLRVSPEIVVERLSGRRVCPNPSCGAAYHVRFMPPKREGVCDRCGTALVLRDDDRPDTVRQRLAAYERQTAALVERYRSLGLLVEIDASGSPKEVGDKVLAALRPEEGKGGVRAACAGGKAGDGQSPGRGGKRGG